MNEKLKKMNENLNEIHSISHAPSSTKLRAYGVLLFQKVHSLKESAARTNIHIMMKALLLAEV